MRRFLIGLSGGFVLGYAAKRTFDALADLAQPAPALDPDPAAYGRLRRALMLSSMARSLAQIGGAAYGLGPLIEPANSNPQGRARRVASIGAALLLSSAIDLPSDFVEGHVLERRYALSKQPAPAWAVDQAKSFAVTLAITVPLIELLATAVERAPRTWPALATAAAFPLLVLANVVAPSLIAPLFNRFEPIEGELEQRLRHLAARYGAGDAKILRVDMSRQTEKANAYVTGLLGSKRIVVGDTLLDHFEGPEIGFVVAHELGHYVARDVWRSVAAGTAATALVFFGAAKFAGEPGRSLATAAGIGRIFFVGSALGIAAGPLIAAFSRSRERAADRFAIAATGDRQAGVAAFTRLRERNMAEEDQPRWMELLFSTHPSLGRRIERLRNGAARPEVAEPPPNSTPTP
jgi:Zn-dependent protease with chaperone function